MTRSERRHPKEHIGCPDCSAGSDTWTSHRQLPQIGQTYQCDSCNAEVFVYDAGEMNVTRKVWRYVTADMVQSLTEEDT